jgi:hypothetical protein
MLYPTAAIVVKRCLIENELESWLDVAESPVHVLQKGELPATRNV